MMMKRFCALLLAALVGACIGFLPFNFNPAKIFMGDTGALLLGYAIPRLHLPFHWYTIPLLLIVVVFATLIYTSLKIMTAAISFWTKASGHITHMLYMTNDFSKYPVQLQLQIGHNKFYIT